MPKYVFRLHALHAGHGDCIWIEYGDETCPHRIVVDCGTMDTYARLKTALDKVLTMQGRNELLIITHVDSDHIAGALPLLAKQEYATMFSDVWFNGRAHLEPSQSLKPFGAVQGEKLTKAIIDRKASWNAVFCGKSVSLDENGTPKRIKLPGGAVLTILSPSWEKLRAMQSRWNDEIKAAGLAPKIKAPPVQPPPLGFESLGALDVDALAAVKFDEDKTEPNGSSIAFLLEYRGRSMLLGADAHPSLLVKSVKALKLNKKLVVDVLKIPHHGSRKNTSKELLDEIRCKVALFSTNGAIFRHPDKEAVARVIKFSPPGVELAFNCRTKYNKMWSKKGLKTRWNYSTSYGIAKNGISIHVL